LSRTIIPELHSGAPTGYRCSTCAWHFILKRDSFVVEYLEEQVAQQAEEVAAVNNALGAEERTSASSISLEVNLNPAGEGDMSRQSLAKLDLVLGCFHSSLRKKEDQTERYMAALSNPLIQILGHPRGRAGQGR
jgi:hypothetical protein